MLRFLPLCSLLALLAVPATATAASDLAVFRADHATAARPARNGTDAELWPDHGPRRTVAPPTEQCAFRAAGAGRLVWDCGPQLIVTDLHGGDAHRQPDPFYRVDEDFDDHVFWTIDTVGSDWLAGVASAARSQDSLLYFNWRTGARHWDDDGDTSATRFPNVDAPGLFTPMCGGWRRMRSKSNRDDVWGRVKTTGHWVLTSDDSTDEGPPRTALHRCGTRDSIAIRDAELTALEPGWLAWEDAHPTVRLRRLRDGRLFSTRLRGLSSDDSLALTDRYVYLNDRRQRLPPRA